MLFNYQYLYDEPEQDLFDYDDTLDDGCYECGGEGYIIADCFEDTCCCADPEDEHGYVPCPICRVANYSLK